MLRLFALSRASALLLKTSPPTRTNNKWIYFFSFLISTQSKNQNPRIIWNKYSIPTRLHRLLFSERDLPCPSSSFHSWNFSFPQLLRIFSIILFFWLYLICFWYLRWDLFYSDTVWAWGDKRHVGPGIYGRWGRVGKLNRLFSHVWIWIKSKLRPPKYIYRDPFDWNWTSVHR